MSLRQNVADHDKLIEGLKADIEALQLQIDSLQSKINSLLLRQVPQQPHYPPYYPPGYTPFCPAPPFYTYPVWCESGASNQTEFEAGAKGGGTDNRSTGITARGTSSGMF